MVVPGGAARLKAASLGKDGMNAIRQWLANGGTYVGFCGGAGLALTQKNSQESLGICHWARGEYSHRIFHLLSGHVLAATAEGQRLEMPIWWPGRFAPGQSGDVAVMARYEKPGHDLWIADIPFASMPESVRKKWLGGQNGQEGNFFPPGQPLAVGGNFGRGRYLLCYAHLETPQSPAANQWLCDLLAEICGLKTRGKSVPPWICAQNFTCGEEDISESLLFAGDMRETLDKARQLMGFLFLKGMELGLLFRRNSWLMGWRSGIAGMACNNLLAALSMLEKISPNEATTRFWNERGEWFCGQFSAFLHDALTIFWELRLRETLGAKGMEFPRNADISRQCVEILGHPMLGGGSVKYLQEFLEELIWLGQDSVDVI